jgi:hypothetical protein
MRICKPTKLITKFANLKFANVIQNIISLHRMKSQELLFISIFWGKLTKTHMNMGYGNKSYLILFRPFDLQSNARLCYNLSTFMIIFPIHSTTNFFIYIMNNKQFKIIFIVAPCISKINLSLHTNTPHTNRHSNRSTHRTQAYKNSWYAATPSKQHISVF